MKKKWQYKVKKKEMRERKLEQYLNVLGKKGWEVFTIRHRGLLIKGKKTYFFYMKRKIRKRGWKEQGKIYES